MNKPKSQHGGARPGAGRPPFGKTALKNRHVMLSDEHVEKAKKLGNGHLSAGVRLTVERS